MVGGECGNPPMKVSINPSLPGIGLIPMPTLGVNDWFNPPATAFQITGPKVLNSSMLSQWSRHHPSTMCNFNRRTFCHAAVRLLWRHQSLRVRPSTLIRGWNGLLLKGGTPVRMCFICWSPATSHILMRGKPLVWDRKQRFQSSLNLHIKNRYILPETEKDWTAVLISITSGWLSRSCRKNTDEWAFLRSGGLNSQNLGGLRIFGNFLVFSWEMDLVDGSYSRFYMRSNSNLKNDDWKNRKQ